METYALPNLPAVALIEVQAADAAAEQIQFDEDTAGRPETIGSPQETSSFLKRRHFTKHMPHWLPAKLPK